MFIDPDLLRMGAEFSRSAGTISRRGAVEFASAGIGAAAFGDFEAARAFHRALDSTHQRQSNNMVDHHAELKILAEKADTAATKFVVQDERAAADVTAAGRLLH
jgi:hypothetical protein